MSVEERDRYTGHMTTGHSWNGITELNSRVPRLWYICFAIAFLFSVAYWVLMPAWPGMESHTQGLLGFDQKKVVKQQRIEAEQNTAMWRDQITNTSLSELADNAEVMTLVRRAGPALFEDNCAGCHGDLGQGATNYPSLNDDAWLWGNEPESIYKTLQHGINSGHSQARIAQMPAFGNSGLLDSESIHDVALYVQSLSNPLIGNGSNVSELLQVNNGKSVYQAQCVACHGSNGQGNPLFGAPNLTDTHWIYGYPLKTLIETIVAGRAGQMPYWEDRLDDNLLKILSLYVPTLSEDAEIHHSDDRTKTDNS